MSARTLKTTGARWAGRILTLALVFTVAGCFDDEPKTDESPTGGTGSVTQPPTTPTANRAPTISGSPVTTAKISLTYTFQPSASDADGDRLTFEIRSKPDWATFNTITGRLEGIPPAGSTGTVTGVQITVSDGKTTTSLAPFNIDVLEPVVGSAELAWQPPTENEDGTPLADLSGYVIRYGKTIGALDQSIRIENAGTTAYVVENLIEGTWYFSLSSINGSGVESRPTGYVSKTIS